MKRIFIGTLTTLLMISAAEGKSYAEYMQELKGKSTKSTAKKSTSDFSFFSQSKDYKLKQTHSYKKTTSYVPLEKKFDAQIKEVKKEVKAVKKEVHTMSKAIESSNKDLIKEVKAVKKEVQRNNTSHGKQLIPVVPINETTTNTPKNSFLYFGFGYQGLSVEDDNGYFSEYALDDSALDIKAGYGQYFEMEDKDIKIFVTGGFEYLSLEQADMKSITATINSEADLGEDVKGFIGLKTGLSYLVWDIPQDEAIESITSTSPLIGIQAGIEYQFDDGISLVFGIEYTKYFHETQIPLDTLNTNSSYGINISLKFYQ